MSEKLSASVEEVLLVYDHDCPLCRQYSRYVRLRENVGRITIVNAREQSAVMEEITALGLDIDQGMVLKTGEQIYYGADAMHALALISSRSGFFNRLNYLIFRSARLSALLYPVLKSGRTLVLKALRRKRINNLEKDGDSFF